MIVNKITTGYVVQQFETDTEQCISQDFIAGDVEWENDKGEPIDCPNDDLYQPFDMVVA